VYIVTSGELLGAEPEETGCNKRIYIMYPVTDVWELNSIFTNNQIFYIV